MTITDTPPKNKFKPPEGERNSSSADYRAWRDKVAELLHEKGHFSEAERWDYCDHSPRYIINRNDVQIPASAESVWVCSASNEHDAVLFSASCDFRICPDCAHRHTARLMKRYIPVIEKEMGLHPEYRLRTLTLTRSIKLGDAGFKEAAQEGFELIQKALREVVGRDWKSDGAGLLANWEVGEKGHKLHYHCVYFGKWVSQKELSKVWKRLTGGDFVVWVKAVLHNDGYWQGSVSEALKYATKFYKDDPVTGKRKYLSPELTVQLFEDLKGVRRIRSWGSFFNIETVTAHAFCCSECGSAMVRTQIEYFEIWRETGFTRKEWMALIGKSLLQYRTANKSPPENSKSDKRQPKQDSMLPGFDKIHVKGTAHYDY